MLLTACLPDVPGGRIAGMSKRSDTARIDPARRTGWLGFAPAALIGLVWIWSGWYSVCAHCKNRTLFALGGGTFLVQIVEEAYYDDPDFLSHTWWPDPIPPAGLTSHAVIQLAWVLPELHRVFASPVGTWWFIRIPLWFAFLIAIAWPMWRIRRKRMRAKKALMPHDKLCKEWERCRKKRGALRRIGSIVSAVLFLLWMASGAYGVSLYYRALFVVDLFNGTFRIDHSLEDVRANWGPGVSWDFYESDGYSLDWSFPHTADYVQSTIGRWKDINIPLWFPFLLVAVPTAWSWRRSRYPFGFCQACGYDLTGNVSGRCPECGRAIEKCGRTKRAV